MILIAENKLSENLRHCLKCGICRTCKFYKSQKATLVCRALLQKAYEMVEYYEKMEELGKIHPTSLFLGQEIYLLYNNNVVEYKVDTIYINSMDIVYISKSKSKDGSIKSFNEKEVGITVFLTQTEAEQALVERKNNSIDEIREMVKDCCCKLRVSEDFKKEDKNNGQAD